MQARAMTALAAAILMLPAPAAAQSMFDSVRLIGDQRPPVLPYETLHYGRGPHRTMRILAPRSPARHPVVIALQGADFAREAAAYSDAWIPSMLFDEGFAFAAVEHRPAHEGGISGIIEDLAAGIAALVRNAARYRIDPERIVLLGLGAAGHFAALLATDPRHLEAAAVPFATVRAVVVLNGDAFDVSGRMAASNAYRRRQYAQLFGRDGSVQLAYSPMAHLSAPNTPAWLFHALRTEEELVREAETLAAALRAAGAQAQVRHVERSRRNRAATYIGTPQHEETAPLVRFLREATGR
jgi:acetyl esterase/lipase